MSSVDPQLREVFTDPRFPFELNEATLLEYFANSPFYEKESSNEQLRMQGIPMDAIPEHLKQMSGRQFSLYPIRSKSPHVLTVQDIEKDESRRARRSAVFYSYFRSLFKSPDLGTVVAGKVERAAFRVQEAVTALAKHVEVTATEGQTWPFEVNPTKRWIENKLSATSPERVSALSADRVLHESLMAAKEEAEKLFTPPPH